MPWLFLFAGLAIPAFYAVGLLASSDAHYTVADFWRFWTRSMAAVSRRRSEASEARSSIR